MNARAWQHLDFDDPTITPSLAVLDALQQKERELVRYRIPEGFSPYDETVADEIIELQQRVLDALRKLVPPGGRLAVVDPEDHHPPLLFHPHVRFEDVSRERLWGYKHYVMPAWRVGLLPDGDSWCFVGSDFAWEALYLVTGPSELVIRGSRLLSVLDLSSLRLLKRFERLEP
ncbi:hypothetical protein [Archangium violaceum]|uniref:Uncharacterized protein n=1 Tax=Archangium violaceum Cb vi76 TaxID=1406225 RepID=A0A084SIZ2_9BACT|nr:hypothetical protein [Archangium violaceum]KFA88427.1 hypothetical protein Q664_41120 [Archangium violaceum Cb vi76]